MTAYRNKGNKFLSTSALTLGLLAAGTTAALAMDDFTTPTGEQVVGGAASFHRPDAGTLNINQSTDRAVINWDSFNIGEKAKTEFFQPGSGSLAVNRVTGKGTDPTQILGTLKANGRVMVLDRNGVLFGANSRTDVGGIVASTGDVDNNAVMRGDTSLELSNFGDKSVINNGTISVSGAGLAALVAPHTVNNGVIEAKLGKVALASGGERATVDLYGDGLVEIAVGGAKGKALAENNGTIEGATVLMTASGAKEVVDTVINMNGVIKAGSVTQKGGKIILNGGSAGTVKITGTLDVSGVNGGGEVNVTGEDIEVTQDASVFADALNSGNGGLVYFMGGHNALYRGRFFARGGEESGNGGFVELSAKNEVGFDGSVDTRAANGTAGTFLIDPRFSIIHSGWLNNLLGFQLFLSAEALAKSLYTNALVTVSADEYIDVGTSTLGWIPGVGTSDIDLSQHNDWKLVDTDPRWWVIKLQWVNQGGITAGNLQLVSDTVNFNKKLTMGNGSLSVLANTVNLGASIYSRGFIGDTATLMNPARISGTAFLVNVKSSAARIDQGIALAGAGGTVDVFAGNYAQDGIFVNKALTLLGAGNDDTVLTEGQVVITTSGVTVDGFAFDRDSGANAAIWVQGNPGETQNIVIGDNGTGRGGNHIAGNYATGILLSGGGDGAVVIGNTLHNINTGIAAQLWGGLSIKNNILYQTTGNAIDVQDGDGAIILGNAIGYTDLAGTVSAGAGNVAGDGIRVSGSDGVTIGDYGSNEGNKIGDANNGIVVLSGNDIEIIKNVIANSANDGIYLGGLNVTLSEEYDNHIFRNDITGSGRNGITVADSSYVLIGGHGDNSWNTITNSGGDGVNVSGGDHVTVRKNTIQTVTGASGVAVSDSADAQVSENTISDTNHAGIYADHANRIDVENNIISNAGLENSGDYLSGIHVEDSNKAAVTGNTVNNANGDGIRVKGSNNLLVESNILSGIGKNGINVRNANGPARLDSGSGENFNLIIRDNNVGNTDNGDGIRVRNAGNVLISKNRIGTDGSIGSDGIYVYDSGYTRIAGNAVNNANDDGIRAADNFDVEITGNNIGFSGDDGVDLYDNIYADINDNTVLFSGDDGIYVEGTHSSFIRNNIIVLSGDDGIDVWGGYETVIRGNLIAASVDDGIVVEGTGNPNYLYDYEDYGYGGGEGPDWTVKIVDNKIALSGHHGIAAYNTGSLRIARNEVALSGTDFTGWLGDIFGGIEEFGFEGGDEGGDETESYFFALGWGDGDGIHVENAYRYEYYDGGEYETRFFSEEEHRGRTRPAVSIVDNDVRWTGGDGIDVRYSGDVRIAGNNVDSTGIDVTVFDLEAVFEHFFTLDFEQVFTGLNDIVDGEEGSLIALLDYVLPTPEFTLRDNGNGIRLDGNERVRLLSNVISNSGAAGLYAAGDYNGKIVLEDNTFNDNPVGAWFESGFIDLTGETNTFNGGEVALLFAPNLSEEGEYERKRESGTPTGLNLVDNTIGSTEFSGQSSYYIVLENGALFAPGTPTVIDGMNASFDGFTPSSVDGILSADQFNALEGMIHHYSDESTLGLIFFGAVPSDAALGDDDVYNNYSGPNWSYGRFRMTLLGLPNLPGSGNGGNGGNAGGQGGFFGNVADFLANLAPAAGGDDNGKKKNQPVNIAGQLADLEPAAGDQEDPACWSEAVAQAQGGATVNYSFGGSAEESLNQAAACGGSI
ncbi:MAG: right-handed parallel beta-helix repeat-containing protein [Micavibrio sp.]